MSASYGPPVVRGRIIEQADFPKGTAGDAVPDATRWTPITLAGGTSKVVCSGNNSIYMNIVAGSTSGNSASVGFRNSARVTGPNVGLTCLWSPAATANQVMFWCLRTASTTLTSQGVPNDCYVLRIAGSEFRIDKTVSGVGSNLVTGPTFTVTATEDYWIRFECVGASLTANIWSANDPESKGKSCTVLNDVFPNAGGFYMACLNSGAASTRTQRIQSVTLYEPNTVSSIPTRFLPFISTPVTAGVSRTFAAKVDTASGAKAPLATTKTIAAKVGSSTSLSAALPIQAKTLQAKSDLATRIISNFSILGTVAFSVKVAESSRTGLRRVTPPVSSGLGRDFSGKAPSVSSARMVMRRSLRVAAKSGSGSKAKAVLSYKRSFTLVGSPIKPKAASSAKATLSTTTTAQGNIPALPANITAGEPAWRSILMSGYTMCICNNFQGFADKGWHGVYSSFSGTSVIGGFVAPDTYIKEVNGVAVTALGDSDPKYNWQRAHENLGAPGINGGAIGTVLDVDLTPMRAKQKGIIKWWGLKMKLGGTIGQYTGGPWGDLFNTATYDNVAHQYGLYASFLKLTGGDGFYFDPEFLSYPKTIAGHTDAEVLARYEAIGYQMGTAIYSAFPNITITLYGFVWQGDWHDHAIMSQGGASQLNTLKPTNRMIMGMMHAHADLNATGKMYNLDAQWYRGGGGSADQNAFKYSHMRVMAYLSQDLGAAWDQFGPYFHYGAYSWAGSAGVGGSAYLDNLQQAEPSWTNALKNFAKFGGGGLRNDYALGGISGSNGGKESTSFLWQVTRVIINGIQIHQNDNTTPDSAQYRMKSDTTVQVPVPAGTGIVDVQIQTCNGGNNGWGGTSAKTAATKFNYNDGGPNQGSTAAATGPSPPVITSITPTSGPTGTSILITGTNFIAPLGVYSQPIGRVTGMVAAANPASQDTIVVGSTPVNTVAPLITGTVAVGSTLTCGQGTWTNSPTSYSYQWQRGVAATNIGTGNTYTVVTADVGNTLRCVVTASNAGGSTSVITANTIAVPSPVVARDVFLWPFASTSPWNWPIGSGATFGSAITGGNAWVSQATTGYNPAIYKATLSDPLVHVTITTGGGTNPFPTDIRIPANIVVPDPIGGDRNVAVLQPDGNTLWGSWMFYWLVVGQTAEVGVWISEDIRGTGWNAGWCRAVGVNPSSGSIRLHELQAAALNTPHAIPHAMPIAMPGGLYTLGPGGAAPWPQDGSFGDHAGEGTLFAIPSSTPKPAGITGVANAVWEACRDYGAYDCDTTGQGTISFFLDQAIPDSAIGNLWTYADPIIRALRVVTNNTQATPGGPGTRLAPIAPTV